MQDSLRPFVLVTYICVSVFFLFATSLWWYGDWSDARESRYFPVSDGYCNIAVIPIQGDIVAYDGDSMYDSSESSSAIATSGDWVESYIRDAESELGVLGIVAQIDSYGGYASPGHQMMTALQNAAVPTVAYIREVGASSGYLAALGADHIVAAPFAAVGSIGITYSYLENSEKNEKEGVNFVELASGPFKDTGNPNKPLSEAERELYERDIQIYKEIFVSLVAASRGLSTAAVSEIADGSAMPASLALEKGLIDEIGGEDEVRAWFAQELEMNPEEIILCK